LVNRPAAARFFQNTLNGSGLDVHEAIKIFREHFGSIGLFENEMYDGVPELLAEQSTANKRLFIASTKPYFYINKILKHIESSHFFEGVYGSEFDGTLSIKLDLLRHIFSKLILNTD
jgi:phosphoglycolate phosphatase